MRRSDFSYCLPPELIAQHPVSPRSASRLLFLDGATGRRRDLRFVDFPALLRPGDLLVLNNTRVLRARLLGTKETGGRVEAVVERVLGDQRTLTQLRASKPPRPGQWLAFDGTRARVVGRRGEFYELEFIGPETVLEVLERIGHVPLPPYIARRDDRDDVARYQTVYASAPGAVAAPTAGLHFDQPMFERLEAAGVERAFITLHVGAGTFQPVRTDEVRAHRMHSEYVSVSEPVCAQISRARAQGRRIVAVGTTVVRALETAAQGCANAASAGCPAETYESSGRHDSRDGGGRAASGAAAEDVESDRAGAAAASGYAGHLQAATGGPAAAVGRANAARPAPPQGGTRHTAALRPYQGETDIFIYPGYRFRVVDALLTNFHLPESTLLMLVCAFAGTANVLDAYQHAVRERYRFFSYGDAMFVLPHARE